jgi:hypothetical protein
MRRANFVHILPVVLTLLLSSACGGDGGPVSPGSGTGFQGQWDGTWQRTSCTGSCGLVPASAGLRVTLSQSGSEVQGTLEFAVFLVPVTGTVNNGTLSLSGQAHQQQATGRITSWSTTRSGNSMNGSFTFSITADNPADGSATVAATLQNVTKTS